MSTLPGHIASFSLLAMCVSFSGPQFPSLCKMTAMSLPHRFAFKDCKGIPFDVCLAPSWLQEGLSPPCSQPLPSALGRGDPRPAGSRWECRAAVQERMWVDLEISGSLGASFNPHH